MNSDVTSFRQALAGVIRHLSLSNKEWGNEEWKILSEKINQEVLNDAFSQNGLVRSIFSELGEVAQRNNPKSLNRVKEKIADQNPRYGNNFFKSIADLQGMRVNCDISEIEKNIDRIIDIVNKAGGKIYIKGTSEDRPYGPFLSPKSDTEKKYTDITQYVYVFLDKVGYPIEIQVGHPFAAHTFSIDSAIRDNKTSGKIDLWSKGFYNDVKAYVLAKANGVTGTDSSSKEAIVAKAKEIHGGNIPPELQSILDKL